MDTAHYTSLAEFIIDGNGTSSLSQRTQLVRILSRSSTLPKVENIFIRVLKAHPQGFYIEPGKSIAIGADYLAKPLSALLCLRYGLEWQIWYKNQNSTVDPRISDIAACKVAAKFHDLTPNIDKTSIDYIPEELAENILKCKEEENSVLLADQLDFETLQSFHKEQLPQNELNEAQLKVLDHLASPVEYLMMSGGDLRLKVDSDQLLNKYGCRPFPRPEAFTFASSTASSISNRAYNRAQFKRKELIKMSFQKGLAQTLSQFAEEIKSELKRNLGIPDSSTVLLASSGTDISLAVAGIGQTLFQKEVVHILVAADETGSGVPLAIQGCHFSQTTSQGLDVPKGNLIKGFKNVGLKEIILRDKRGQLKTTEEVNQEVEQIITQVLRSGKQPVLHAMDQSKLGYSAPSFRSIKKLKEKHGQDLLIAVDNSQLRMDPEDIQNYLELDCLMILTGSKFFTGPPFNGALLVPENLSEVCASKECSLPEGIDAYFYKNGWPDWPMASNLKKGINLGIYMRWYASLVEIKRYYETPLSLRYLGVEMFCEHVKKTIDNADFLEHLPGYNKPKEKEADPRIMKEIVTIFPFFIKHEGRVFYKEEVDQLYRLLNRDISEEFKTESDVVQRLVKRACHIGQPVATAYKDGTPSGVLRINLGARVISESWKDRDSSMFFKTIEEQMIQINLIVRKIELILEHPTLLGGHGGL